MNKKSWRARGNRCATLSACKSSCPLRICTGGQMLFLEMIHLLKESGFRLMSFEPAFQDAKTGELLQVYGVFFREAC
jgi:hypothetical protein